MKKYTILLLAAALLVIIVLCSPRSSEVLILTEENMEEAYENVLPSAVRIQGSGCYGSGSIFEIGREEIIIVTNAHMTASMDENSFVTFFNGARCSAAVMGSSKRADIGFVRVSCRELSEQQKNRLRSVGKRQKAYENLKKNDCFFMIDIANDTGNPVMYSGAVVEKSKFLPDYGREMLYGDGAAVPGMSGSGIFDCYGNYIGTLSGATEHYELAGVPLDVVLEEYEKLFAD